VKRVSAQTGASRCPRDAAGGAAPFVSYGEQARRLGLGNDAARAVGAANGQNPLPIVLPCHRVIGADGSLTGFGGGLHVKRFLLEHEGALLPLG
jgi:methylated-DNA-[protein]-cysteine S-methyltransferase